MKSQFRETREALRKKRIRPEGINVVKNCTLCPLHKTAQRPIWGRGPYKPRLMIIGEGPGDIEDQTGILFNPNAPSGKVVQKLLDKIGIERKDVYITNATKCFKGYDGKITDAEVKTCKPYLDEEIEAVNPKYVVLFGGPAEKSVIGRGASITKDNGSIIQRDGRFYMPIIHPAYGLRQPEAMKRIEQAFLNFGEFIKNENTNVDPLADIELEVIKTRKQFLKLKKTIQSLPSDTHIAHDFETNSDPSSDKAQIPQKMKEVPPLIGGISFSWSNDYGVYLPVDHQDPQVWEDDPDTYAEVIDFLRWFAKIKLRKISHHFQFERNWFVGVLGVELLNPYADTMLMSHNIDSAKGIHSLKHLAWLVNMGGYELQLEKWFNERGIEPKNRDYTKIDLDVVGRYGAADSVCTYRTFFKLKPTLQERKLFKFFGKHVMPGVYPYCEMESNGYAVDEEYRKSLVKYYERRMEEGSKELSKLLPKHIKEAVASKKTGVVNFNSAPQAGNALRMLIDFDPARERKRYPFNRYADVHGVSRRLKWPTFLTSIEFTTDKGNLTTNSDFLSGLVSYAPLTDKQRDFVKRLQSFKKDSTYLSRYARGAQKYIGLDGRIHSTYLLNGTETFRRAGNDPNPQNWARVPIIKRMVKAEDGNVLLMFDYRNLEVRIAAIKSGDRLLLEIIRDGKDIHCYAACIAYSIPYDQMMNVYKSSKEERDKDPKLNKLYKKYKEYRSIAKTVWWVILFGGGPDKISKEAEIPFDESARCMDEILSQFTGLENMFDTFEEFAEDNGYAETDFGRRRYLEDVYSSDRKIQSHALRQARNTPIQGTASDVTYLAARRTYELIKSEYKQVKIIQEVHDSLSYEVPVEQAMEFYVKVKNIMESITTKSLRVIKFEVEGKIGRHMGSNIEVDDDFVKKYMKRPKALYKFLTKDFEQPPEYYADAS